ncbi:MAG TPA: tRNA (guanosine(46)-N7)-methyltransferase TrmB [Alphaproteobacteria bacterium]|nr:tRNA (guanosine(46)-N7)-methyltransferase TrmB [Alphaproteobacteria bacterium]
MTQITLTLPRPKFWGRKIARPLKPLQKKRLEDHLPEIELSFEALKNFCLKHCELWLEIGYGGGEHLVEQARAHQNKTFLGCEPFLHGAVHILEEKERLSLNNIFVMTQDARLTLLSLPNESLEGCFILFADPWPKKRHHKRRIICDETLDNIHRVLKPQGVLRLATDHLGYQEWIKDLLSRRSDFNVEFFTTQHPTSWPVTRYEQKAQEAQRECHYYELTKAS